MMLRDGAIPKLASLAFRKKKKKQNEIGISLYYKKQKKRRIQTKAQTQQLVQKNTHWSIILSC